MFYFSVVRMSLCGLRSILLCLYFVAMCWLTDGAGRPLDTSGATLDKGHPSSLSLVQGYLRGKEWKAWRAQRQKTAVTLKNLLSICHCQGGFQPKDSRPLSNTSKHSLAQLLTHSRHSTKEHFSHSAEDMTYVASFSVCGFYFSLSIGLVSGNPQCHLVMERKEKKSKQSSKKLAISFEQGNWNIIWLRSQFN